MYVREFCQVLGVNPWRADTLLLETPTGCWAQSRVQGFHCQINENKLAAHPVPGLLSAVSFFSWPCTMRDLSSPTRIEPMHLALEES